MKSYVRKKHRPFMSLTYGKNYYPWQKLTPRFETVSSQKIHRSVRLAVISDLHCNVYGQNQTELLELLQKGNPDVVVMPETSWNMPIPIPARIFC